MSNVEIKIAFPGEGLVQSAHKKPPDILCKRTDAGINICDGKMWNGFGSILYQTDGDKKLNISVNKVYV